MDMPNILVVDDDPISLRILIDHLEELHYSVDGASSGQAALELLQTHPKKYSLVIVDRMMEGVDGMGLLQYIKNDQALKNIPVIMETGEAQPEEFIAAIKAGAFDFIYKPIESKLLMYVVKNALEKEVLERQNSFDGF